MSMTHTSPGAVSEANVSRAANQTHANLMVKTAVASVGAELVSARDSHSVLRADTRSAPTQASAALDEPEELSFEKLSEISRGAQKLQDIRIIRLPPMRMITYRYKTGEASDLDEDKMQNLFKDYGFLPTPGMRDCFMRQEPSNEWLMLMKIPEDYNNETKFADEYLPGGLYAVASTFFENLDDTFLLLREWVNSNADFMPDKQRSEMLEEILPWDIVKKTGKYQQDIFIPIKEKRDGHEQY